MLASPFLSKFIHRVPIKALVIDEASQIKVAEYINVFLLFKNTLKKVCFIGDLKQCEYFKYYYIIFIHILLI